MTLQPTIDALTTAVADLQQAGVTFANEIAAARSDVESVNMNRDAAIAAAVAPLQARIDAFTEAEAGLTAREQAVAGREDSLGDAEARVAAAEARATEAEARLASFKQRLGEMAAEA